MKELFKNFARGRGYGRRQNSDQVMTSPSIAHLFSSTEPRELERYVVTAYPQA
jgi:hypothetical protein